MIVDQTIEFRMQQCEFLPLALVHPVGKGFHQCHLDATGNLLVSKHVLRNRLRHGPSRSSINRGRGTVLYRPRALCYAAGGMERSARSK